MSKTQDGQRRRTDGLCGLAVLLLAAPLPGLAQETTSFFDQLPLSSVGMSVKVWQHRMAGSEIEVKPIKDRDVPLVLRIVGVFPHGTDFRYDFEYYGLEEGKYDLREFLQRKDGTPLGDLPEMIVEVTPMRPPGQWAPNKLEAARAPYLGGYRTLGVAAGVAWVLGLVLIVAWIRSGRRKQQADQGQVAHASLADRLRPAVDDALAGKLTDRQQAELERLLVAFWRRRLDLTNVKAAEAIVVLREHEEAGPLLKQLEDWLHRPGSDREVDVMALLKPYQGLPSDALDPIQREVVGELRV